jgi:hypothetical protein
MPPLQNIQHEAFIQHLTTQVKNPPDNDQPIRAGNSYKAVYGVNGDVGASNASRLLSRDDIRARFVELLEANPATSDEGLKQKLSHLLTNARSEGVQLNALQTAMKVKGHLSDGQAQQNVNVAQVSFNKVINTTNTPMTDKTQVATEEHTTNIEHNQ